MAFDLRRGTKWFYGAPKIKIKIKIKIKSRAKAEQKQSKVYLIYGDPNVGGGLPPIAVGQSCM